MGATVQAWVAAQEAEEKQITKEKSEFEKRVRAKMEMMEANEFQKALKSQKQESDKFESADPYPPGTIPIPIPIHHPRDNTCGHAHHPTPTHLRAHTPDLLAEDAWTPGAHHGL